MPTTRGAALPLASSAEPGEQQRKPAEPALRCSLSHRAQALLQRWAELCTACLAGACHPSSSARLATVHRHAGQPGIQPGGDPAYRHRPPGAIWCLLQPDHGWPRAAVTGLLERRGAHTEQGGPQCSAWTAASRTLQQVRAASGTYARAQVRQRRLTRAVCRWRAPQLQPA